MFGSGCKPSRGARGWVSRFEYIPHDNLIETPVRLTKPGGVLLLLVLMGIGEYLEAGAGFR
jgi:hypothetical protein